MRARLVPGARFVAEANMPYRLRDHLFCCRSGDRLVFLDLKADRYFCLPALLEADFAALDWEQPLLDPGGALIATRLLVWSAEHCALSPACRVPAARRDIVALSARRGSARAVDVSRAVAAQFSAKLRLRGQHILKIVQRLDRIPSARTARSPAPARLPELAAAFQESARLVRAADRCLPRSLALMALCKREGFHPKLVFGVRTDPFAAHCWVQEGEAVLTGDYEEARMFSPIASFP